MNIQYSVTPEWKKIIISPTLIKNMLPVTQRAMLESAGTFLANKIFEHGHLRTGRTVGSINTSIPSQTSITISAKYGAIYEERRGGDHALFSIGLKFLKPELPKIIIAFTMDAIDSGLAGSATLKKKRATTYISKYKKGGKWHYVYADTGRASRSSGASRGGGRG